MVAHMGDWHAQLRSDLLNRLDSRPVLLAGIVTRPPDQYLGPVCAVTSTRGAW
jgi:hypothetical protein